MQEQDTTTRRGTPADYLSVADLARELSLNENTVYTLLQKSFLPGRKLGGSWRVRRSDLDAIFDKRIAG